MFPRLLKKELKEMISVSLIMSMIFFFMVYGLMGLGFEKVQKSVGERPRVVLVGAGKIAEEIEKRADVIKASDVENALKTAEEKDLSAVIVVKSDSAVEVIWLVKGLGIMDAAGKEPVEMMLRSIEEDMKRQLMLKSGLNPSELESVLKIEERTFIKEKEFPVSVEVLAQSLASYTMFQPMLIAFIVSFAGSTLTTAIAMERTNKTLETLLTLPVKRINIALAKLVASSIVGVMLGGAYMAGFSFYMSKTIPNESASPNLNLISTSDIIVSGLSLVIALYSGLVICLMVGFLAKDAKSAATLSFPVSMMAFIPMIVGIFKDLDTIALPFRIALSIIPFTHPIFSMRLLVFGERSLVYGGILYNALLGVLLTFIVQKMFESDIVILGVSLKRR